MIIKIKDKIPNVERAAFIAENCTISGQVNLGKDSSVWHGVTMRGDRIAINIGDRSNIQENSVIHGDPGFPVNVGEDVTIGHNAIIHGCTIGNNVVIGMGAIVLNGADIGENSIIGAGALVPQGTKIPANSLYVGLPGKVVKELGQDVIKTNLENANLYVENAKIYAKAQEEKRS